MPEPKSNIAAGEIVADNYRVLGVAGTGGMGLVYRALDLRLERVVALKFLPPHLNASEHEKERFLREARIASSLDHPNIGVIYGVEDSGDGSAFIIMAFYEGQSLADLIRKGPLPPQRAVDIASQMAKGLAEAHSRNIIHRDIKPSNVMLTPSGVVKIVDFGLAHVVSANTASQTGVAGTIAYMSPEQSMGERVDHRCDIWALGVVTAEMLSGRNPFAGDSVPAIFFAILNQPPQNIDTLHPALQPVLYRALSKDVDSRFASCKEFLAALERSSRELPAAEEEIHPEATMKSSGSILNKARDSVEMWRVREGASRSAFRPAERRKKWATPLLLMLVFAVTGASALLWFVPPLHSRMAELLGAEPEQKHIAVLPFDNIGSNPENQALIDGLVESLTGRLSNLDVGNQSLWVVPKIVVESHHITDPADALKALGANLVIKGTVERDGTDIHLMANLINTKTLRQIGSVDVDDPLGNLSTLEDETVAKLAQLMNISVASGMPRRTSGRVDPAAYEDYLKALGYIDRFDKPGNLDLAIGALQTATHQDPKFALGYAAMGEAYRRKYEVTKDRRWLAEGEAQAKKAAEIDSSIPGVYVTLGNIHNSTGQHDLAMQELQHAMELDPRDASAEMGLARSYELAGRNGEAEEAYKKAAALRPDSWLGYANLGAFYDRQAMYLQAVAADQRAIQLSPDNAQMYSNLGGACVDSGDPKLLPVGEQALRKSLQLSPTYAGYTNMGNLLLLERRGPEAEAALKQALKLHDGDYNSWSSLLIAYELQKKDADAAVARHHAIALAEQAVKLQPTDAFAQSTLAYLYAEDKQNENALTRIQAALALSPKDTNVLANVGQAYENIGDRSKAVEYIGKALQMGYPLIQIQAEPTLQKLLQDPGLGLPRK